MRTAAIGVVVVGMAMVVGGCGGNRVDKVTDEKAGIADKDFSQEEKMTLVDRIAGDTSLSNDDRREKLKSVAWQASYGYRVRNRAIDALAADASDVDNADTRNMLVLMLGVEPDRGVVEHVCELAAKRGWTDLTPSIVRVWARKMVTIKDEERVEKIALEKLFPNRPVEATVYEVFAAPEVAGKGTAGERTEKARAAAWEVLTRIDKDGSKRKSLVGAGGSAVGGGPAMGDLQAGTKEMGIVPMSAPELAWLRRLRSSANAGWWRETSAVVAGLDGSKREGLAMRHLEALRWAAKYRAQWMGMEKDALAGEITARLKGRDIHVRSEDGGDAGKGSERFKDNVKRMCWADLVCVLVVDDAVHAANAGELWDQAKQDQGDKTTEYGGNLIAGASEGEWKGELFSPRATQRFSDTRFVVSDEMLGAGATAVVQYHFHAQKDNNDDFAGPSAGDIEYARDSGRLCVVFTPVKAGVFGVDLYFGDGVRTDLGTIGVGK